MRIIVGLLVAGMFLGVVPRVEAVKLSTTWDEQVPDSIVDSRSMSLVQTEVLSKTDKMTSQKWFQMTSVSVPLVVAGLAVIPGKECFTDWRNDYTPKFDGGIDEKLQYLPALSPAILMLGLKGFGYEGRSSWGRMLVSDAFSATLMFSVANTLKSVVSVRRPDGSDCRSFPSGHTATAFMAATMLHKEYGCRSPWFSIGAYTVATATGVSRVLSNRHYISDVLVGAGIGILSTELGYFFADLIFKERGLNFDEQPFVAIENPSSLGLRMGFTTPLGKIKLGDNLLLNPGMGAQVGVEGVYFLNNYVGCGASATLSNTPISLVEHSDVALEAIDEVRVMAGGYFKYPCTNRCSVGGKVSAGYNYITHSAVGGNGIKLGNHNFVWSAGVSLGYVLRRNFGAKLFCDYTFTTLSYQLTPSTEWGISSAQMGKSSAHSLVWGASANILF